MTREEKHKILDDIIHYVSTINEAGIENALEKYVDEPEHEEQKYFEGQLFFIFDDSKYKRPALIQADETMHILDCKEAIPACDLSPTSPEYINLLFSIFGNANYITLHLNWLYMWKNKPFYKPDYVGYKWQKGFAIQKLRIDLPQDIDFRDCIWQRPEGGSE